MGGSLWNPGSPIPTSLIPVNRAGGVGVFDATVGANAYFKALKAGVNVTIVDNGDGTISIAAPGDFGRVLFSVGGIVNLHAAAFNDYTLDSAFAADVFVRFSIDNAVLSNVSFTGFAGGDQGRFIILKNDTITNGFNLVLKDGAGTGGSTASAAANRFAFGSVRDDETRDVVIPPQESVILSYIDSRWRMVSATFPVLSSLGGDVVGPYQMLSLKQSQLDFALNGQLFAPQITANQNNYMPAGIASANTLFLDSDAARDITGLDFVGTQNPSGNGRILAVINKGGFNITLKANNAGSIAARRFNISADKVLAAKDGCLLYYSASGFANALGWHTIG